MTVYTQQYQQKLEHMQDMLLLQEGFLKYFPDSFVDWFNTKILIRYVVNYYCIIQSILCS